MPKRIAARQWATWPNAYRLNSYWTARETNEVELVSKASPKDRWTRVVDVPATRSASQPYPAVVMKAG